MKEKIKITEYLYPDVMNALTKHDDLVEEQLKISLNGHDYIWDAIGEELKELSDEGKVVYDKLCSQNGIDIIMKHITIHRDELYFDMDESDLCSGYLAFRLPITLNLKELLNELQK